MSNDFFAHGTACIDEGATIGEGTRIWHFCHVMPKAIIGQRCSLGQNVFVANNVRIGDNVKIQNNVSVYEGVTLEDDVFCGPSMVFTNVRNPRSAFPKGSTAEYDRTHVGRGATIGANATVVCGSSVGAWSFIAAGAVVTRDVPDYAMIVGVPGRQIGWACRCGERLPESEDATGTIVCPHCERTYEDSVSGLELIGEP